MSSDLVVSVSGEVDVGFLVLHVDGDSADLGQHVLVITEVRQEIHDGVADLTEHRLTETHADQRAWVV